MRWLLALALLGLTAFAPSAAVLAAVPAGGLSAAQLDEAFRVYGDTSGRWSGGDSTASVLLPDGRVVWLFSDTFVGPINADGTRPRGTPMVHNSIVIQDGTAMVETRTGGTAALPTSLVGGDRDSQPDDAGFWVGDGTVEASTLKVLYNHYRRTGTGGLDVEMTGTWLATFDLPALSLRSLTDLQLGTRVAWGAAILEDGDYTYVYGTELAGAMRFAHVARVPAGGLAGPWQFWTGSDWSAQEADSGRLLSGTGTAYAVQRMGSQYALVTVDSHIVFSPTIVAYTAASPTGPFAGPIILHTAPEPQPGGAVIVYDARVHGALARPGKLLFSYNVNSLNAEDTYADARLYRPRFVEMDWPRPEPDPATLPAAPTGLALMVDDDGVVHLSWNAVEGAVRYWIYLRDVTAGATHVGRIPAGLTQTTGALAALTTGHTYEFSVSAENAAGEGPRGTVVAVTAAIPPPPAPTGVTAAANTTGSITVGWSPVPRAWRYQVFRRDLTAGQTSFEGLSKIGSDNTSQELAWMSNGHEYEFYVVAEHGGGSSLPSAAVRATVRNEAPPAPTGLTATSNADGTITLRWTAPASGLWYWVYQRDLTAGDADYARLPLPISSGTEMTAGYLMHEHLYEFAVAGLSGGGEGPKSAPARAAARYPLPPAPTNLRATPGDGQVTLSWNATAPEHWYWVYQRDLTAGETAAGRLPLPISQGTTMTAGYLTNGHTYEWAVSAIGPGGSEGPKSAPVQAVPNPPLPVKPTGLTATPNADGTITLSWTMPTANAWHWVEMRDVTAGQAWGRLPYPLTSGSTFTAGLLQHEHTYEFRVVAFNIAGEGPTSDAVVATCRYARPGAPTGLRGNTGGDGTIELNWIPPGPGGFYYWIYFRDVTAGEAFLKGIYPTDKPSAGLGFLRNGHVYEFKVTAENLGGEGPASTPIQVTALGGLPAAPTNLSATPGDGQVTLGWTASPTASVWYWIEMRPAGGAWQRLPYPLSTCCTFNVTLLANGTTYDFRVRATSASGDGAPSNVATAKPMPPMPQPPTGLTASPGDGRVTLRWTASATPNVWYWIEYRASGGAWQRLPYPVSTCCTFDVSYLTNGTTYEFRLRSTNLAGDSAPSNVASARPMPPFPQPPSGLSATPALGKATLRWTASPTANVWYWIEMRPTGGAWQRLPLPITTCCTFVADYLNQPSYEFRVRATNLSGDSAPGNTVAVTIPAPPAPTGIKAEQAGPYQAKISWNPVPGADAYIIYHSVASGGLGTTICRPLEPLPYPVMGGGTSSFTADYLFSGFIHCWAVAAVKYGRIGARSGIDSMSPLWENVLYTEARCYFFDCGAPVQGQKGVISSRRASVDGGIVVARAFINGNSPYLPISDGFNRGFSSSPGASAKITVAWDTGRGQLGALVHRSCVFDLCKTALPLRFEYSGANDTQRVDYNYVWTEPTSGDEVRFNWMASNAITYPVWHLGWHIDAEVRMWRYSGANYAAELHADHFPSYEAYQYPHYTTLGFPEARTLATCGQAQIDGLTDSPGERRWCQ